MKKVFPFFVLGIITVLFFYKTFFQGLIPFPGDLLIAEYQPWKSYSYLGYAPGSYPSKKQYFDTLRQMYPWRTFVNKELKQGRIPLWNPHNFSGHPLMANIQSQVFYPLTIVYFIFSQPVAWTILVFLQPLLAAIGMFLFLQTKQRSSAASLLGSLSYGFSQYMTVFLEYNTIGHVIIWLPFLLYAIERKKDVLFVFSLVCCAFAGHLQIFGAILAFQLFYALFITHTLKKTFMLTIISLGIASIQLIPTFELFQYSARTNHEYQDFINRLLIQPKQLLTLLNPDLFGNPAVGNYLLHDSYPGKALFFGSFMLFFAFMGIVHKKKDSAAVFFSFSSLVLFLIITNNPITKLLYAFPIPFLSQSAPGNFIFLSTFFLSYLGAYGIDLWIKNKHAKTSLFLITAMMVIILIGFFTKNLNLIQSMVIFSSIQYGTLIGIVLLSKRFHKKILLVFILFFTAGELFYFFQKFNPFVPQELIYPQTPIAEYLKTHNPARFYGYGVANIQANFATQLSLYDPNGYDPLYPKDYGAYIYSSHTGVFPTSFDRSISSDATIAQGFGNKPFDEHRYRKEMIDLLDVRFIINTKDNGTTEETFPHESYPLIYQDDSFMVHENVTAYPKAFFRSSANASAQITVYEPSFIRIEVETPITQNLFLSDTYMPGWKAFVNDIQVPIMKAHTTFREIEIPQGKHTVTLFYRPMSFILGAFVSLLSSISLLMYTIWRKMKA
jgi:hypothetical protein